MWWQVQEEELVSRSVVDDDPNTDILSYCPVKDVSIANHIFEPILIGRMSTAIIGEFPKHAIGEPTNHLIQWNLSLPAESTQTPYHLPGNSTWQLNE